MLIGASAGRRFTVKSSSIVVLQASQATRSQ